MPLSYREWRALAITNYDIVSKNYNRKVYEAVVTNQDTGLSDFVQLTLREVLDKCDGSIFETQLRRAIMRCVYTDERLEPQIRPIMDLIYEVDG